MAHPYDPVGTDERCPYGLMPCGGPPLSKVDIETIRRWIIGGRPNTEGDPHIRTIDGVNYDFQSAGEFVLLRGENLEIQARQTAVTTAGPLGSNAHTGLSSCVSVNTAVALRVGSHRVSYQPDIRAVTIEPSAGAQPSANSLVLRIDGKPTEVTAREIPRPSGGRILRIGATGGIQVDYPGGTIVVITPAWWAHHQIWYMNIDVRHARATEGIMGAIAPGNWLPALPDGRFMGPRPADVQQRYKDLYETFADAWRVSDATSLFAYEPGLSTAAFTVDSWPMESPRSCTAPLQPGGPRGTAPPPLAQAEAEKLCAAIAAVDRKANCVQDVMATGEPGFAATYLATERIEAKAVPSPPVLGSPDENADVTPTGRFTWTSVPSVAGGALIYRHCVWSADALYDFNKCVVIAGPPPAGRGILYAGVVGMLALILFVVLLLTGRKHKRALLVVLAIAILPAVLLAFYFGRTAGGTADLSATTAQLQPGKVYFWKVIAEDSEGQAVESQTRRFVAR